MLAQKPTGLEDPIKLLDISPILAPKVLKNHQQKKYTEAFFRPILAPVIQAKNKFLIIRFSSFGDVTQALSIPAKLKELSPEAEVHWITRQDLSSLLEGHPQIDRIWRLDRKLGFWGLLKLIAELKRQRFSHIYDAHNNMRSHLISLMLRPPMALSRIFEPPIFLRKSQKRWKRLLLFKFRINLYQQPFSGQRDLLEPLNKWGISSQLPPPPQIFIASTAVSKVKILLEQKGFAGKFVALAPSAAYELKRWPVEHWQTLVRMLPETRFVCLGGPTDTFIQQIADVDPKRVLNLAGALSLQESSAAIALSETLVTNDTGLLHVAEQLGKKTVALMGPAPFGFPSRPSTHILQIDLKCRPCSKHGQGPCVNKVKFHQCLVDITPVQVAKLLSVTTEKSHQGTFA